MRLRQRLRHDDLLVEQLPISGPATDIILRHYHSVGTRATSGTVDMTSRIRAALALGAQAHNLISVARLYNYHHGHFPNPLRPMTFHDKVVLRIMFDRRPLLTVAADKIAARTYAAERLGKSVLPALYIATTSPEAIPFDHLPDRFVVKPSHASGYIEIVADKRSLNRAILLRRCRDWLRINYYKRHGEWGYKHVIPQIMVEEFVDDGSGTAPRDYKFFVFDGTVAMIQVDTHRFSGHRRSLFDRDWTRLPVSYGYKPIAEEDARRPPHFEALCAAAEALGRGVDFLRADFYDTERQPYFGEITMTPGAAIQRFSSREFDRRLGAMWKMPQLTRIIRGIA